MDFELSPEGMGVRKLYGRVKNLPPDAALWRVQEPEKTEPVNGDTTRTTNPDEIKRFFSDNLGPS